MPLREYLCPNNHKFERLELNINIQPEYSRECAECGQLATLVEFSQPGPPRLIGDGFFRPSVAGPMIGKPDSSKAWSELKQRGLA